jgi:hypothetical protein
MPVFLVTLLAGLPGLIGDYFKQKNALESQRLETERQIEVAKQQMASDIAKAQMVVEQTIVGATGPYFKYFTFCMWFGPFIVGVIFPNYSKAIFANLATMPEWYVQSCMLIMFTVWGISVSAPVVGSIFSGLTSFLADRRSDKIEMKKVDKAAFYDAVRHLKGQVTPADVKIMDPILDEVNKD